MCGLLHLVPKRNEGLQNFRLFRAMESLTFHHLHFAESLCSPSVLAPETVPMAEVSASCPEVQQVAQPAFVMSNPVLSPFFPMGKFSEVFVLRWGVWDWFVFSSFPLTHILVWQLGPTADFPSWGFPALFWFLPQLVQPCHVSLSFFPPQH